METTTEIRAVRAFAVRAMSAAALSEIRGRDDAGRPAAPFADVEGGAPLRCCLRRSAVGERIALVSYAPLRRWAAETGAEPGAYDEQGPVFVHADACPGFTGDGAPGDGFIGDGFIGDGAPGDGFIGDGASSAGSAHPFGEAHRTVRRYSGEGRILGGALVGAGGLDAALREAFDDPAVAFVHVRAVEYGCYLYEVRRT
ncbi:DUF1203 domain-containing protein [Streptomyces sp. SAS_272]|uniref:DUF1203 domain-containing protein n=1 Tax=Streptomyces sp. SAS_272 TaxID=3412747 RepID=UPI00403D227E